METTKNLNAMKRKTIGDRIFSIILIAGMTIFALSFLFIFVWMFLNSLRNPANYNAEPLKLFDFSNQESLFTNYKEVFDYEVRKTILVNGKRTSVTLNVLTMLKNSGLQILFSVLGGLIFPPAVGYVVAKYNFKLKGVIVTTVIMTMCIPMIGTTASTLKFYDKLNMINTWWPVILGSSGGLGFGVLLYGNYFGAMPWEYVESAKLDGAGNLRAYLSIMLPQATPILLAQSVMTLIGAWNDYTTSFMYMPNMPTLAYGINGLSSYYSNAKPIAFAALFMMSAVTLILYGCFSKTIMSSFSAGGLKG